MPKPSATSDFLVKGNIDWKVKPSRKASRAPPMPKVATQNKEDAGKKVGDKKKDWKNSDRPIVIRNPYPILLLVALAIVLIYTLTWFAGITKPPVMLPDDQSKPPCIDGQKRTCTLAECTGIFTCIDGIWGGCKWAQVCVPHEREVCLSQSCPYGVRECNPCGTGFGPCKAP
jgi:hypothetical protein